MNYVGQFKDDTESPTTAAVVTAAFRNAVDSNKIRGFTVDADSIKNTGNNPSCFAIWVKFSADDILKCFSYFTQKTGFDISCRLSPLDPVFWKKI